MSTRLASDTLPDLTPRERTRYSRHLALPEVGLDGQRRLKAGRVLIVGAGGLGSPAALYLTAAGVGTLGLVDFDAVDVTNLQRQILHATPDVGRHKLQSAARRLEALNPDTRLELHDCALTSANALEILSRYDVVVDGTDNFATRYLVNDACVMLRKPNVYGSVFRFEGQAAVFATPGGPCYRCLHPEPPPPGLIPNCAEGGVLGVLPGLIGTIQATETVKLLVGVGDVLAGRLLIYDALHMRFRELTLPKDAECPVCGASATIRTLVDYERVCGDAPMTTIPETTVLELKARRDRGDVPALLDVREPHEIAICRIDGATEIPLAQLPQRLGELDASRELIVYCRMGGRSARAVDFLRRSGFAHAVNLKGGILAWIDEVDPSQPKY
jgi:adenylyltransferase/sulfurtransferase